MSESSMPFAPLMFSDVSEGSSVTPTSERRKSTLQLVPEWLIGVEVSTILKVSPPTVFEVWDRYVVLITL